MNPDTDSDRYGFVSIKQKTETGTKKETELFSLIERRK